MDLLPAALVLDDSRSSLCGLYCSCRGGAAIAAPLATALRILPGLRTLHLPSNALGNDGAAVLAAALPCLHALASLDPSHNNLGVGAAAALAAMRPRLLALTHLDLSSNPFNPRSMDSVAAFGMHLKCLRALLLLDVFNADPARALTSPGMVPRSLKRLELGPTGPGGAQLCDMMRQTPDITALLLPHRPGASTDHVVLRKDLSALRALTRLAALDVSSWVRPEEGPDHLSVLSALTALTWLALPRMVPSGTPPAAPPTLCALAALTQLRHLSVRDAALRGGAPGAPYVLAPLTTLRALTSLDLRYALHPDTSVAVYQAHVAALTSLSQLHALWLAHRLRVRSIAAPPLADPAAPLPAALLAWTALETVQADFRDAEHLLHAAAWLQAVPRVMSIDLASSWYTHMHGTNTPLALPPGLTHLALRLGRFTDRGTDFARPTQPLLLPQSVAEAACAAAPLRSLNLAGCVCGPAYADHVWRCLAVLTGLTSLGLTQQLDRAEECCAAMTEHLPALTSLECIVVQSDVQRQSPASGEIGWPAASFAHVITQLQRLTRLCLWEGARPNAAFWLIVCRELPRLCEVPLRASHLPAELHVLLRNEHIVCCGGLSGSWAERLMD